MKSHRKGLSVLARESWLDSIAADVRRKGLRTLKLRKGGATVADITEFARRWGFAVNVREDGVTVDVARKKAA